MQELASAYCEAIKIGPMNRAEFFTSHMGRIPSRAYMSKVVRLALANSRRLRLQEAAEGPDRERMLRALEPSLREERSTRHDK